MHRLSLLPRPEQLPAGLADHAVTQRADALPAIVTSVMWKNRSSGGEEPSAFSITSIAFGPCTWKRYDLRRPSVRSAHRWSSSTSHVVAAGLGVEGDPVQRGSAADEVEPVLLEVEEDHVADHVALRRARHEVLRPVDAEALEAVDREVGEQPQGVRPFHRQIVHVVRLVEEDARLLPGLLLVAPVRVLGRHPRKHVGPGRVVAQQLDRALGRVEQVLETPITHVDPPFSGRRPAAGGPRPRRAPLSGTSIRPFRLSSRAWIVAPRQVAGSIPARPIVSDVAQQRARS